MRLAIVTTHPIQYYAPWFRWIARHSSIELKVFYLWDREASANRDPGFGRAVAWDLPLLEGYDYEFVPNTSRKPGSDRFWGIRNAELGKRIAEWNPDAALLVGYRYASMMQLIVRSKARRGFPLLIRGDSHRLVETANSERGSRNLRASAMKSDVKRKVIQRIYSRFDAFLYVGRANRDYFRVHGVPDEKLFFSPHAVDNERFFAAELVAKNQARSWRAELGIPEEHLLILFAGKFEDKKRPLELLAAFEQIQRPERQGAGDRGQSSGCGYPTSLLFVGNGHLEEELRRRAALIPNVFFAPFQNQTEMPRTYAACDLFVLPSFGPEESWGLAVNEAMCMGKAVIVSSHVGCASDLVDNGVNGLVFEAGEVQALTNALREALSDRERLRQWGEAGREIVRRYDYAHTTAGLEQALAFTLAGTPNSQTTHVE